MNRGLTRREWLSTSAASIVGAAGAEAWGRLVQEAAPVKTRIFWTWDHSTEWVLNRPGAQTLGASNYYARTTENFIQDYTALFEWCGRHRIDAVVVWGLLRDSHGGLESAKRLCEAAQKQGVRLLSGVGLNAYGGVYYEGSSRYSLEHHLASHPELFATDSAGHRLVPNFGIWGPRPTSHACPSRPENQEFVAESLRWLFKNLPLGGVQIETGDTGVCLCARCRERRKHPVSRLSWEDMALMYPLAASAIRSVSPQAWIICETYSQPEPAADPKKAEDFGGGKPAWAEECLAQFPRETFVQWVGDKLVFPKRSVPWTEAGRVESGDRRHVLRAHFSTYWEGIRGELAIEGIGDLVRQGVAHGFDAISIFGEISPFQTGAELNYLAFEDFGSSSNPKASVDLFLKEKAAPLLGGEEEAREFLGLARLRADPGAIPNALKRIYARIGKVPAPAARRWTWLAGHLASVIYPKEP